MEDGARERFAIGDLVRVSENGKAHRIGMRSGVAKVVGFSRDNTCVRVSQNGKTPLSYGISYVEKVPNE